MGTRQVVYFKSGTEVGCKTWRNNEINFSYNLRLMSNADFGFIDLDVCNGRGVQSVKYAEQIIPKSYNKELYFC